MLKVLMYLFENYMDNDARLISDKNVIGVELAKAGFNPVEIEQAMTWLQGYLNQKETEKDAIECSHSTFRIFSEEEDQRMSEEAKVLLMSLEQMNVVSPQTREMVIDRLMALEYDIIEPVDVKWVVMMVLFHQKNSKEALTLMQDVVMHGDTVH